MRVLLTGARGFVGRQVCSLLATRREIELHACSRAATEDSRSCTWHQLDLLDNEAVRALLSNVQPSHLVHLAWYTEHGAYWQDQINLRWLQASAQLLRDFCIGGGRGVVVAGSCAEYMGRGGVYEKDHGLVPHTLYGASKRALHLLSAQICRDHSVTLAWARLFMLYGPGEDGRRLVPYLLRRLLDNEQAQCGPGELIRDYLHVEDAARAIEALLGADADGDFDVGSGNGIRLQQLGEIICEELQGAAGVQFGARPANPDEPPSIVADSRPLRSVTGWRPQIALPDGLRAYLARLADSDAPENIS